MIKWTLALVACGAVLQTGTAWAQRGGGGGMMRGMGPMAGLQVLVTPEGQKELSLTEDQVSKARELSENMRATMMERFQSLQDVPQEDRQARGQEMMRELSADVKKQIAEMLDEKQQKRFDEISLQLMGVDAFAQPEVLEKLKVTDEQKAKMDVLGSEMQEAMMAAREESQGDFQGVMRRMQEIREETKTKVLALMTDDQKELWKEMTGKPFEMPAGPFGGGRRRPD